MSMNAVGRPTRPEDTAETSAAFKSLTGGKGLLQYERLIFEKKTIPARGLISRILILRLRIWAIWCAAMIWVYRA